VTERPPIPNDFGLKWRAALFDARAPAEPMRMAWVLLDQGYTHGSTVIDITRRTVSRECRFTTPWSFQRARDWLLEHGFLVVLVTGRSKATASVWELRQPDADERHVGQGERDAQRDAEPDAQRDAEPDAVERQRSSRSLSPRPRGRALARAPANDVDVPNAPALVAFYIDTCRAEKIEPPKRLIGQVARQVGELVGEGYPARTIAEALRLMIAARTNPSTLPSFIPEAQAGPRRRHEHVADVVLRTVFEDGRP
jgi:hypothetical protein